MTIVITGAAGALGSAVTHHLVRAGNKVAALGSPRSGAELGKLAAEAGPGCIAVPIDVGSGGAWAEALGRIERELGPPRGAVLIAGAWKGGKPMHDEADDAVWRAMISSNLETAQASIRALLPGMVARGAGSIVRSEEHTSELQSLRHLV